MSIRILYLPAARLTFDGALAKQVFTQSKQLLSDLPDVTLTAPEDLLSDPADLQTFIEANGTAYDLVVFQDITFVDGDFISNTIDLVNAPILVWGVREPSIGGRLRLNTLTGVMSTANTLTVNHRKYLYLIGNPDDKTTAKALQQKIDVLYLIKRLHAMNIGVVGKYPNGFYFSDTNNQVLHDTFGISVKNYELQDWFEESAQVSEADYQPEMAFADQNIVQLDKTAQEVQKFAQFTTVAKKHIEADHLNTIAMRCWPDFFLQLHAAPCGVFSQLTDEGFPTACEADIHGSLSMYILQELTHGTAAYLGDIVNFIPEDNEIVMWHCGFAPYSLANPKTGATPGVHPNRKIGLAMDFGLKPGKATLFRVSYTPEGYRFIVTSGEVQDKANAYQGTSAHIKLDPKVNDFLDQAITEGYEPHFALAYGDVTKQIKEMGRILGLETIQI